MERFVIKSNLIWCFFMCKFSSVCLLERLRKPGTYGQCKSGVPHRRHRSRPQHFYGGWNGSIPEGCRTLSVWRKVKVLRHTRRINSLSSGSRRGLLRTCKNLPFDRKRLEERDRPSWVHFFSRIYSSYSCLLLVKHF